MQKLHQISPTTIAQSGSTQVTEYMDFLCFELHRRCQIDKRFLQVKLVNYEEDRVTIIIDISNVYVVGFIAGNARRHFEDCPLEADYVALFPGSVQLSYVIYF
ncbi:hypothetical protein C1H46_042063 [Malus baccata]|uniref:rRNA N-glycosylase n=1 Tax=Malus baccata TaxID=106549 RepID=A0A540KDU8_MALBA|nr:hypothetical protein C1H46_042063 [Malus baccata]